MVLVSRTSRTFTVAEKSAVNAPVPFRTKAGTFAVVQMVVPFLICVAMSSPTGNDWAEYVTDLYGRNQKYAPTEMHRSNTTPTAMNQSNLLVFMLCASLTATDRLCRLKQ